jgi:hypothetical protein
LQVPGIYRLAEDIEVDPREDNDYWPIPGDPAYPMSIYYLGGLGWAGEQGVG